MPSLPKTIFDYYWEKINVNMTKCHLGRGLTEYFLYKGVASGEEATHTIYICRARAGATKTLSLAVME